MGEKDYFRQLAEALELLDKLKTWNSTKKPKDNDYSIKLEWLWGSGTVGYSEVVNAVKPYIEANLSDYIDAVIVKQEALVVKLKGICKNLL